MVRKAGDAFLRAISTQKVPIYSGVGCWMVCSVGMLLFNKMAIKAFPAPCSLVVVQMTFSVITLTICCRSSLHFGSWFDVMRWSMVVPPFFAGMLLTSILALKSAPMTLVITFRALSPVLSLIAELFFPNPLRVSVPMLVCIMGMVIGCCLYVMELRASYVGLAWVFVNNFMGVADRLLQRLMLAKDQYPVDISKSGLALLSNLFGMVPLAIAAIVSHEHAALPGIVAALDMYSAAWIFASCVVGVGISYCGIWAQSLISATSFLVLVNANKFIIIFIEAVIMRTKTVTRFQTLGACITIFAGIAYGRAREILEDDKTKLMEERPLKKQLPVECRL